MIEIRWKDGQLPTRADLESIFGDLHDPEVLESYRRGENLETIQTFVGEIDRKDQRQAVQPHVAAFGVFWQDPAHSGSDFSCTVMQVSYDDIYRRGGHVIDTFFIHRQLSADEAMAYGFLLSTNALAIPAGPEWVDIRNAGERGLP